jgi:predicted outer membrane repeat protein
MSKKGTMVIIYVSKTGNNSNDGLSWGNAVASLAKAVELANTILTEQTTCSIWVANGSYSVTSTATINAKVSTYSLYIYGGFVGNETSLNQRQNTEGNVTILDGGNAHTILKNKPYSGSAQLLYIDNLTFQHTRNGSCIDLRNITSLELTNCTFLDTHNTNDATAGGSIILYAYEKRITASIVNCTFYQSFAENLGGAIYGKNVNLNVYYCTFVKNKSNNYGGAIFCTSSDLNIRNSIFWGNLSSKDTRTNQITVTNSTVNDEFTITNCVVDGGINNLYGVQVSSSDAIYEDDPLLDSVPRDNGGNVQTIAVPSNSPAVGAARHYNDITTDARGYARSENSPTIGAYEYIPTYTLKITAGYIIDTDGSYISQKEYKAGDVVSIIAKEAELGKQFKNWVSDPVLDGIFSDENASTTIVTIPEQNLSVTAVFETIVEPDPDNPDPDNPDPDNPDPDNPDPDNPDPDNPDTPVYYTLTVKNGFIIDADAPQTSGTYTANSKINIKADTTNTNKKFKEWSSNYSSESLFADPSNISTTITMPNSDIVVFAVLVDNPFGDIKEKTNQVKIQKINIANDRAISDGSYVGVFVNDELRGKQLIRNRDVTSTTITPKNGNNYITIGVCNNPNNCGYDYYFDNSFIQQEASTSTLNFKHNSDKFNGHYIDPFYSGTDNSFTVDKHSQTITYSFKEEEEEEEGEEEEEEPILPDPGTITAEVDNAAYTIAESNLVCQYGNPFYGANCPNDTELPGGSVCSVIGSNTFDACVDKQVINSSDSTAQALASAMSISDAQLESCLIQNIEVKAFCDKIHMYAQMLEDLLTPEESRFTDWKDRIIVHYDRSNNSYSIKHAPKNNLNIGNGIIYVYLNSFHTETHSGLGASYSCLADSKVISIPTNLTTINNISIYYDTAPGSSEPPILDDAMSIFIPITEDNIGFYFSRSSTDVGFSIHNDSTKLISDIATMTSHSDFLHCTAVEPHTNSVNAGSYINKNSEDIETLNLKAINLAVSGLACLYGNATSQGFDCSTSTTRFGYSVEHICSGGTGSCSSSSNIEGMCAYNEPARDLDENIFLAEDPWKADLQALSTQLSMRVCLDCDKVGYSSGGGGGSSVSASCSASCSGCSKAFSVFTS